MFQGVFPSDGLRDRRCRLHVELAVDKSTQRVDVLGSETVEAQVADFLAELMDGVLGHWRLRDSLKSIREVARMPSVGSYGTMNYCMAFP